MNNFLNSNSDAKFEDKEFPASLDYIHSENEEILNFDSDIKNEIFELRDCITFYTIEKILGKNFINDNKNQFPFQVPFNVNNEIISEGFFGNPFLLTSLISIFYTRGNYIFDIFENFSFNSNGIYGVRMLIQGELKLILVDDLFPVLREKKKNLLMLSHTKKESWLPILEKAYAKANGKSYLKNLFGTPLDAFNSIAFAPTCIYQHKKYNKKSKSNLIWNKILEASLKKYAICASTDENFEDLDLDLLDFFNKDNNNKDNSSVGNSSSNNSNMPFNKDNQNLNISNNSNFSPINSNFDCNKTFSVLDIFEFEDFRLIKLWTPKKKDISKWDGLFADDGDGWSKELIEYVCYSKTPGIIYLTFEEYVTIFSWTYICKIENNFLYRSLKSKTFKTEFNNFDKEKENDFNENEINNEIKIDKLNEECKKIKKFIYLILIKNSSIKNIK